jgi:hypothetical protein
LQTHDYQLSGFSEEMDKLMAAKQTGRETMLLFPARHKTIGEK